MESRQKGKKTKKKKDKVQWWVTGGWVLVWEEDNAASCEFPKGYWWDKKKTAKNSKFELIQ